MVKRRRGGEGACGRGDGYANNGVCCGPAVVGGCMVRGRDPCSRGNYGEAGKGRV